MGKDKIIIDNQSNMDLVDALKQVRKIVKHGRISGSGKSYCYATRVLITDQLSSKTYNIYAKRNKNSDTFRIM